MGALSPVLDGGASQLQLQNAAPAATRKDKRAHKGRRQMEDSFMIHLYKVKMCTRTMPHNWKLCPWAHPGEAAARRHPSCHAADLCHAVRMNRECPHGESCAWSRNIFEAHLHPDRYRTVMCAMGEGCGRNICFFAHNEQELRTPPNKAPASPAAAAAAVRPPLAVHLAPAQQQELRTPYSRAPGSLLSGELPLAADLAVDALQQLSIAAHPAGAASSSSNAAGSSAAGSTSSSSASNIVSSPRGRVMTAAVQPNSPRSASSASSSSGGGAASPAAASATAGFPALHLTGNSGMCPAITPPTGLASNSSNNTVQVQQGVACAMPSEPLTDLLSLQQQMAGRAAAAAATMGGAARSPTHRLPYAAAMHMTADSLSSMVAAGGLSSPVSASAAAAAAVAAAGYTSPVAAASSAAGSPPAAHSPLFAAGSPFMTPPRNMQHLLPTQELLPSPLSLPAAASPQHLYTLQQQQQQQQPAAAAAQHLYHSQLLAASTAAGPAAAAAADPGINSLAAGLLQQQQQQQRQFEARNALLAKELLAAQSASAMQAAVQQQQQAIVLLLHRSLQQQQQYNSLLLQQGFNLAGTMPPVNGAAAWQREAMHAAGQQELALHDMLLLAEVQEASAGVWG